MSSKEQRMVKRTTSWCNREVPKQARTIATSNKEEQEKQQRQEH